MATKLVGKTVDRAAELLFGTLLQMLTWLGLSDLIPPPERPPCLPVLCSS